MAKFNGQDVFFSPQMFREGGDTAFVDVIFTEENGTVTCNKTYAEVVAIKDESNTRYILNSSLNTGTILTRNTNNVTALSFMSITQGDTVIQTEHILMSSTGIEYWHTPLNVVQSTGTSETDVMSQKATTDEINALKSDITDLQTSLIGVSDLIGGDA